MRVALIAALCSVAFAGCMSSADPVPLPTAPSQAQQWTDADDPPEYPVSAESAIAAQQAWDNMPPSDQAVECRSFWGMSDQEYFNNWRADGFDADLIDAVLNVLWRECS